MYQVQRRSPRIHLESSVTLICPDGTRNGVLENISLHGMLIRTDARLPVGGYAEINFRDPESREQRVVKAGVVVIRSEKDWMALELRKMDLDSMLLLRELHGHKLAQA